MDELGGVLFEKPELQLERMSRLSRVQPATYRAQPTQTTQTTSTQTTQPLTISQPPQNQKPDETKGRSRIVNRYSYLI